MNLTAKYNRAEQTGWSLQFDDSSVQVKFAVVKTHQRFSLCHKRLIVMLTLKYRVGVLKFTSAIPV
jgi:hypothetical protein